MAVVARSAVSFAGVSVSAAAAAVVVVVVVDENPGSYRRWPSGAAAHRGKQRRARANAVESVGASGSEGEESSPSVLSTSAHCLVNTSQTSLLSPRPTSLDETGREHASAGVQPARPALGVVEDMASAVPSSSSAAAAAALTGPAASERGWLLPAWIHPTETGEDEGKIVVWFFRLGCTLTPFP